MRGRGVRRFRLVRSLALGLFGGGGGLVSRIPSAGGLKLGHGGVSGTIALWTTLIHLTEDGGGLKTSFCLGVNCFLDQFVPAVELSRRCSIWAFTDGLSSS